jgi:short-subunit dehydrogenase
MINVNVQALMILSTLFVKRYKNESGAQLINLSSTAGYNMSPSVLYCASKQFVSVFTEGLALQLQWDNAALKAKILAPHTTKTEFARTATDDAEFDYAKHYKKSHTAEEMAGFLLQLYDSDATVGYVDRDTMEFELSGPKLNWM